MAYAPHHNGDVRSQVQLGVENRLPVILGYIVNDSGANYEYAENLTDVSLLGWDADLPHIIYVRGVGKNGQGDGESRYAKVLKTVIYVAVDEDENGQPVLEKWKLKRHEKYDTDWIFEK
jgi:hypothetical protein